MRADCSVSRPESLVIVDSLLRLTYLLVVCCCRVDIGIVFKEYTVKLGNTAICKSVIKGARRVGVFFS